MNFPRFLMLGKNRFLLSILALSIGIGISYAVPHDAQSQIYLGDYQSTSCPALGNGPTAVELTSSQVGIRNISPKNIKLKTKHGSFQSVSTSPLFVDSTFGSSYTLSSKSGGGGVAAALCEPGSADQWFVGGSGSITGAGVLDIVNSGLSSSSVEIHPYSSRSALPPITVRIPANSDTSVRLDALVAGDALMALEVITRAGRVTSFMYDQRKKGLASLGMDYVAAGAQPGKHLVIPIGLNPSSAHGKVKNAIRVLVPGQIAATLSVKIESADGEFTPVGLDSKVVPHGKVVELPITNLISSSLFSVVIDSDQPLVASLLSQNNADFGWSAASTPFSKMALNFASLTPSFLFTGTNLSIDLQMVLDNGKRVSKTLSDSSFIAWSPGSKIRTITFTSRGKNPVYGGALISSQSGFAYLPLESNTTPTQTLLPITDVHTLTH